MKIKIEIGSRIKKIGCLCRGHKWRRTDKYEIDCHDILFGGARSSIWIDFWVCERCNKNKHSIEQLPF